MHSSASSSCVTSCSRTSFAASAASSWEPLACCRRRSACCRRTRATAAWPQSVANASADSEVQADPALSSTLTTSVWPSAEATRSGVRPPARKCSLAPALSSSITTAVWPISAATRSGVHPFSSRAFTSHECCMRITVSSACPPPAAACSNVDKPFSAQRASTLPPSAIHRITVLVSPWHAAAPRRCGSIVANAARERGGIKIDRWNKS
eukprot:scaffold4514_cov62-Phaeocystis_antarctica.AAC.2